MARYMESFSQHVIPALIRLAKSDIGHTYESYNPETREWSSKINFKHPLGRFLGSTTHYTGYFDAEKNLYAIYEKKTITNPVAQNMTTADAAVNRWIELERAAQEGIPMVGIEPEEELAPIVTRSGSRRFSSGGEAEAAFKEWQAEKGKKVHPWRYVGDIDDPTRPAGKPRYEYMGGTAQEEALTVPFEEQRAIWRTSPSGKQYRIETKWEEHPFKEGRVKATRLDLEDLEAEARMSYKGKGEYTPHSLEFQYPLDLESKDWGTPEYEYEPSIGYDPRKVREETEEYQTQQALNRAMLQADTGFEFSDVEEYSPSDADIRAAMGRMERWYAAQSDWSPEGEVVYERGKSEWLSENVPVKELAFIEEVVSEEPIEKKGARKPKTRRRK